MALQENGNGGRRKYRRMNADLEDDDDVSQLDIHDDHISQLGNGKSKAKRYVMVCAVFASLNSVLLGYDVGVMSGAILYIKKDLNIDEFQEELLVGILSIISLLGSLAGGRTSDAIGRKWTMAFAAIVFQSGAAIMAFAPSFRVLMIGRLLAGVGIGFGVMIAPVYIAEIAPAVTRGSLTSFPEIFINLGILLGYVSNYIFARLPSNINWRVMLGVGVLPSVFILLALCLIPESPRWLVMKNRTEEAKIVLLNTIENETEAEERLAEIKLAAGLANVENYEDKAVWKELLFPSPGVRRMLIAGCGIQLFQQVTGIDATVYYSPQILKNAGIKDDKKSLAATVAVGITKTIFILVAIFLIDRVGRKPLLYVSTIGMTACLFGLGLTLSLLPNCLVGAKLSLLWICGNAAFFSIGLGPICWVLTSEIFPLRLRAQASALGAVGSRVSSGLVAMSFLSISNVITFGGTFFLFSAISIIAVLFVYFCVPETKGKSLEEIETMFEREGRLQGGEVELGDTEHLVPNK